MAKGTTKDTTEKIIAKEDTVTKADNNNDLALQLEEMKKKMEAMMLLFGQGSNTQAPQTSADPEEEVISLTPGILNLATEGNGKGNIYTFTEFGEMQLIPTTDLKMILRNNKQFALDGRFYITNKELIRANNLTSAYKAIIKQDIFKELFSAPKATFSKMFESIPQAQKQIFADLVVTKIYNNEDVDLNIVSLAGEIMGRDLNQEAQTAKLIYPKLEK